MSHIFHRNPQQTPPTAVRGQGLYIIDAAGKRYLDASGGAAVSLPGRQPAASASVATRTKTGPSLEIVMRVSFHRFGRAHLDTAILQPIQYE